MTSASVSARELANQVAREIADAAGEYDGPRLKVVAGRERSIPFMVEAPSLRGKRLEELENDRMDFGRLVYSAEEGSYTDHLGHRRPMRILSHYFFDLKIEKGAYTGWVRVWQRPDD